MKKYSSVLTLFARSTIYKLLGLLALTGLVEAGLFYMAMRPDLPLESVFHASRIPLAAAVSFLLWTALLTMHAFQQAGYTLHRMSLNARQLFLCHAIYNALCYVIFWSFQACLMTALFHWYGAQADETMFGPQSIMLAFYRVDYLHSLLPLADWTRYLRNGLTALSMGALAAFPLARRGSRGSQIWLIVMALFTIWTFPAAMGSRTGDVLLSLLAIAVFAGLTLASGSENELDSAEDAPQMEASSVFSETEVSQDETTR